MEREACILTSPISLAEIISKFIRNKRNPEEPEKAVSTLSVLANVGPEEAMEAGKIHAEIKQKIKDFGLADAFVLSLARKKGARVVTGDPHFKNFRECIFIE